MQHKISPLIIEKVREGLINLRKNPGVTASVDFTGTGNVLESGELDKAIKERNSSKISSIIENGISWGEIYQLELPIITGFPPSSSVQSLEVSMLSFETDENILLHRLFSSTKTL